MAELGRKAALGGVERYDIVVNPVLLDRENMSAALCISASLLDELRELGCPTVTVPSTDKILYDPNEVLAWMKSFRSEDEVELTPLGQELKAQQASKSQDN